MMFIVAALAFVAAASAAQLRGGARLAAGPNDCGGPGYAIKFTNITLTPYPPVAGQTAILNATGIAGEAIAALNPNTATLNVALDTVPLYTTQYNTCGNNVITLPLGFGTVNVYSLSCPITSGASVSISAALSLPTGLPTGDYDVQLVAQDDSSAGVYCVDIPFTW